MGQKVNPNGFRFGITKERNAQWYAPKDKFITYLLEDQKIRKYLDKFVREYQIDNVETIRSQANDILVKIHTAKPGVVLGQGGENLKKINNDIKKYIRNKDAKLNLEVISVDIPEISARLVAEEIAVQLENRGSFRSAQKFAIRNAMKSGAKGIKTSVSGRLNGVDMARREGYTEGEMKLHTLRQNVDFAMANSSTKYGIIGVKVWISKGLVLDGGKNARTKKN